MWKWNASPPPVSFCDLLSEILWQRKREGKQEETKTSGRRKEHLQCLSMDAVLLWVARRHWANQTNPPAQTRRCFTTAKGKQIENRLSSSSLTTEAIFPASPRRTGKGLPGVSFTKTPTLSLASDWLSQESAIGSNINVRASSSHGHQFPYLTLFPYLTHQCGNSAENVFLSTAPSQPLNKAGS